MIILKKKEIHSIKGMLKGACSIVIVSLLIASLSTINFAYGQVEIFPTPNDIIFRDHSLIIDIESEGTETIPIIIYVLDNGFPAKEVDREKFDVSFDDSSWQKHRIVVTPMPGSGIPDDGKIHAKNNYEIHIQSEDYPQIDEFVTFHKTHTSDLQQGTRTTFDTVLRCPDVGVVVEADIDGDGICDAWENSATDELIITDSPGGLPGTYSIDCTLTNTNGCGSDMPDIFVEVDWIDSHKPDPKALELVKTAFLNKSIRLHIQVDSEQAYGHLPRIAFPGDDAGPGPKGFDQLKQSQFGTKAERDLPDWSDQRNLKHQVFHYALFGHNDISGTDQTGIGEVLGNDFVVTLGKWTGKVGSEDQQSGTLMHELGHNLGLHHGGDMFDQMNNKPNLFSVMTYVRQFSDFDSNRNLDYSSQELGHHHSSNLEWSLNETAIQGYARGLWTYTGHETEVIIFSCPDEAPNPYSAEYLTGKTGGVDWNCNGNPTDSGEFPLNVNNFASWPTPPDEWLTGHNDWAAINYAFKDSPGTYADGRHDSMTKNELTFEGATINRISVLLSLYRQIDMFNENDFSMGLPDHSTKSVSNDGHNPSGEPKKDSFKSELRIAIKSINIHDITGTQKTIQSIDDALQKTLHPKNYQKIQPITANLIGTYDKALGFGFIPTEEELYDPIIDASKIEDMIIKVEKFVDNTDPTKVECGIPFVIKNNQCMCPLGLEEDDEGDCKPHIIWAPLKQFKDGVAPENVECKDGLELLLSKNVKPACVKPTSVAKLIIYGWAPE